MVVANIDLSGAASRGAVTVLAGQWVRFCMQLVTVAILARTLMPSDFGLYAMVAAIAGIATLLSDFGLSMAAMRSVELGHQQRSNLFWANSCMGLIAAVAVALSAHPIAVFYDNPFAKTICQVLAVTFLVQAASAQLRAELARKLKLISLTVCDIGASTAGATAAIVVAMNQGGVWALISQQLAFAGIQLVLLLLIGRWLPTLPRRVAGMNRLFRFGANTGGVQLVNYATANVDTVLLGRVWGPDVVGVYNQAYQLFRVPLQQLASPMTQVAVPTLARIKDAQTFEIYVRRAQLILSYVLGGAFLTAAALSIPLLNVLLGPRWAAATSLFCILAIGGVFQSLGYVYYWIFIAKDLTGIQLKYALLTRAVMVALIAISLPFGNTGVAVASSLGLAVNWLVLSIFALPHAGLRWTTLARASVRPLMVFLGQFAIVYPLSIVTRDHTSGVIQLLLLVAVALAYLFLVQLFAPLVRNDFRLILNTALKARGRSN